MGDAAPDLPDDVGALREALLDWYARSARSYPWRETDDPYAILVSEVMSQQTQLDRIVEPYEAFLERWPDVGALAGADRSAVVAFWSGHGLGYNNRARHLHGAARTVVESFDGELPESVEALQRLEGVGPYTARAVASFAFGADTAVVETNVRRVLHRAFGVPDDEDAFAAAAERLLPGGDSRAWNNAVMELGGTVCRPTPRCDDGPCPWRERCRAYETGDFTAPDVPTQPTFEGSRRQFRGRVVRALSEHDELVLEALGPRIRVDYAPDGDGGREWLRGLISDLVDDGLVETEERDGETVARLRQ